MSLRQKVFRSPEGLWRVPARSLWDGARQFLPRPVRGVGRGVLRLANPLKWVGRKVWGSVRAARRAAGTRLSSSVHAPPVPVPGIVIQAGSLPRRTTHAR